MRHWPFRILLMVGLPVASLTARAAGPTLPLGTSPTSGLTLEQAMDQAETHSFAARIADKTADEADNRAGQTRDQLGPKVSLEAQDAWISKQVNKTTGKQILTTKVPERIENAAAVLTQPLTGIAVLLVKLKADSLLADAARHDAAQTPSERCARRTP